MTQLTQKHCQPCEGKVNPLTYNQAKILLAEIPGWQLSEDGKMIYRDYKFKNFKETMEFVNAVADIANQENHHPDLEVSYSNCLVKFTTHAIHGLSENDFICASKIDSYTMQCPSK